LTIHFMGYCGGLANLWFICTDNCVLVFKTLRSWFIRISDRGKVLLDYLIKVQIIELFAIILFWDLKIMTYRISNCYLKCILATAYLMAFSFVWFFLRFDLLS